MAPRRNVDDDRILDLIREEFSKFKATVVAEITAEVTASMKKEIKCLHDQIRKQEQEIESLKQSFIKSEENRLKDQRREVSNNIIMRGVTESMKESSQDTSTKALDILKIVIPSVKVLKAVRIGRAMGSRPRMIKVTVDDREMRNRILQEAEKFRHSCLKNVYLDRDLPFLDRKEAARLRLKLKQLKNEHPNESVRIYRGKLMINDQEVDKEQPLQHLFPIN